MCVCVFVSLFYLFSIFFSLPFVSLRLNEVFFFQEEFLIHVSVMPLQSLESLNKDLEAPWALNLDAHAWNLC